MTRADIPAHIRSFVFDIDGCLAVDGEPIAGAFETLAELRDRGYGFVFLTNDSYLSTSAWQKKAVALGFDFPDLAVITAGQILVQLAADRYPGGKVLLFGSDALGREAENLGLKLLTTERGHEADVVLVARTPSFNYDDMTAGLRALRAGAGFITASMARTIPSNDGPVPGTGATTNALAFASRRRAVIAGKPSALAARTCLQIAGFDLKHTAFVGDDPELDIATAKRVQAFSILVLTGSTAAEDVQTLKPQLTPDLVMNSITDIPGLLWA
ncbi:MAG: HAD-IIA family hydrolase [Acidimicrobiaceae bacterium]|nr:HAD-IIA family hydrolase [Acidimicrobiaceae bacterium]